MPARPMPESLTSVLRRARELELAAKHTDRWVSARDALSTLLLAAYQAGWRQGELAEVVGLSAGAVRLRIDAARRRVGDGPVGVVVDPPVQPSRVRPRRAVLAAPAVERQWLTLGEAAEHCDRSTGTIFSWYRRGVLPNTDTRGGGTFLYLRADLDRVLAAPRRGRRQIYPDFGWLLAAIASSPV